MLTLVQTMACRLVGVESLSELVYCLMALGNKLGWYSNQSSANPYRKRLLKLVSAKLVPFNLRFSVPTPVSIILQLRGEVHHE